MDTNFTFPLKPKKLFSTTLKGLTLLSIVFLITGAALQLNQTSAVAESSFWEDEFDGPLLEEGWDWVNEADEWGFDQGFLHIMASSSPTRLLRPVTDSDFVIETRVLFEPDTNFQFAGLVIFQDESNFLQFGRAFCDIEGPCVGNGIYFDHIENDGWVEPNFATQVDNLSEAYVRLERQGNMVKGFFSYEGITWFEIGTHWIPDDFDVNEVGLTALGGVNTPDGDIPADFDYFELTEGGGFLPEGYHDYDEGDVPSWACNGNVSVGGWAADPDNREVDLAIEVIVNGEPLDERLYASEYRPDLDEAEVCVDGNCSFHSPLELPPFIGSNSIFVYAQDIPTREWVQLSSSPKTITCLTTDIYAYHPETGETQAVTNTPDTYEFNPRWSPSGEKIAHDVWNSDFSEHGVYITNVLTKESTPLEGADRGSYPAWSPNGRWIAFDHGADGDYSLFIVPSTGGTPTLIKEDAFMASWAPNSKRLAFNRPSDGSIRTVDINSGNETLIVEQGNSPAWSPNGQWIAYENGGNIWKVRVNIKGVPQDEPIQLTSKIVWADRPNWSQNSQTIAYHSGISGNTDIWTIPASGGTASWLTGAPNLDDYDPNFSNNGEFVAYSSFSPEGQAPREWAAAYTYDPPPGTFEPGVHPYHFEFEWSVPEHGTWDEQRGELEVSPDAPDYPGYVLLRGPVELRGFGTPEGYECEEIGEINPNQITRFLVGYLPGYGEITYPEAQAHFESINAQVVWNGNSAEITQHEIIPFNWDPWFQYVCGFTEAPPRMNLRVNYGHDWIESFYEAGHDVLIKVTDPDEIIKATANVVTEQRADWGGEPGFQTLDWSWFDGDGNEMEFPPDIQPYDWVIAEVDNGVSAQVQIGEISGMIDFESDTIQGGISAPWLSDEVAVECFPWGAPDPQPEMKYDSVFPNSEDRYNCSWAGEWEIKLGQDVGVGYFNPDGHWVANAFYTNAEIRAWLGNQRVDGYQWPLGAEISLSIDGTDLGTQQVQGDEGWTWVSFELGDWVLEPGQQIVMASDAARKTHKILPVSITNIDIDTNFVEGTASENGRIIFCLYDGGCDPPAELDADGSGNWSISYGEAPDIYPGSGMDATEFDEDGDGTSYEYWVPVTFFITSTDDVVDNDGVCTLREAIIAANTNSPSGDAEGECPAGTDSQTDTIILAADQIYSLTIGGANENDSYSGDLDIWDNSAALDLIIIVEGGGTATISQDAEVGDRVLENHGASVQIEGLTLTGGSEGEHGGGSILNRGSLTLVNSTITGNSTVLDGGGIANSGQLIMDASTISSNSAQFGGGLANWPDGTASIQNGSVIGGDPNEGQGNIAIDDGGGIFNYGMLTMSDSTISGNSARYGGGLANWGGEVALSVSSISSNSATYDGGGLLNKDGGVMTIQDSSVISSNQAVEGSGGGIVNWGATVALTNSTVYENSSAWGGGIFTEGGTLSLDASTVSDNTANNDAGGIFIKGSATVNIQNDSQIIENSATWGGGISSWASTLIIDASAVSGNTVTNSGGGILIHDGGSAVIQNGSVISGNHAQWEGGISIWSGSTLTVDGSLISGNMASGSAGGLGSSAEVVLTNSQILNNSAPWSGGIGNWGGIMTISFCTISNNTAVNDAGGIGNSGNLTIDASTIAYNTAGGSGGGIVAWDGTLLVTGSVIRNNLATGDGDAVYSTVNGENYTNVTGSCIVDNGDTALFNNQEAWQDFTNNWWGDASGPYHPIDNPTGPGDSVSDYIDFYDWLIEPLGFCP